MSQAFTAIFVRDSHGNDTQAMLTGIQYVAPIALVKTPTKFRMINWSKTRAHFLQSFPGPCTFPFQVPTILFKHVYQSL